MDSFRRQWTSWAIGSIAYAHSRHDPAGGELASYAGIPVAPDDNDIKTAEYRIQTRIFTFIFYQWSSTEAKTRYRSKTILHRSRIRFLILSNFRQFGRFIRISVYLSQSGRSLWMKSFSIFYFLFQPRSRLTSSVLTTLSSPFPTFPSLGSLKSCLFLCFSPKDSVSSPVICANHHRGLPSKLNFELELEVRMGVISF